VLGDRVEDVAPSERLVDSVATLVTGKAGMDAQMERMMRMMDENFTGAKKVLEVNMRHPLMKNLAALRSQPGPFSIATFTRVPMVRRVVDLLLEELEAIRSTQPIGPEELRKFIDYNVGRFGLSLETSDAVLASLVDLEVHGLPDDSLDTFRSRVRAITVDDVARAAKEHLHPDRAAIVVLGPAAAIVPALEDLGEIEVRQP